MDFEDGKLVWKISGLGVFESLHNLLKNYEISIVSGRTPQGYSISWVGPLGPEMTIFVCQIHH